MDESRGIDIRPRGGGNGDDEFGSHLTSRRAGYFEETICTSGVESLRIYLSA